MAADITIDRSLLLKMAADPRHLELLPALQAFNAKREMAKQTKKCKPCGGRKTSGGGPSSQDVQVALRQIANFVSDKPNVRTRLKQLLGASGVRIKYQKGDNSGSAIKKF